MPRVLPMILLLVGSVAAAQSPGTPPASKHLRLPPIEGVAKPLPRAFDMSPVLRYEEKTDCRAYVVKVAARTPHSPVASNPAAPAARPDERIDGCFIMRRETADPFGRPGRADPDGMI